MHTPCHPRKSDGWGRGVGEKNVVEKTRVCPAEKGRKAVQRDTKSRSY